MAMYRSDTLIKTLRVQSGLTQQQLAEGIVTKETISRIERGLHVPTTYVLEKLLERLSVDPKKYISAVISPEDFTLGKIKLDYETLFHAKKYEEAEKLVDEFEKLYGDNLFHSQFLKSARGNLALFHKGDYDRTLGYAYEGLKMTLPNFELSSIRQCVFSNIEVSFLNLIAAVYYMREDYDTAITILEDAIKSLERDYLEATEQSKIYLYLVSNLTQFAMHAERYEICYEMSKFGIVHSKKQKETLALPNLYCKLGATAFKLGKIDEAKRVIDLARHLYLGLERDRELVWLNDVMLKEIGFDY